jgi:predicted TIM-barrel fold metal-dependent hydrolase
MIVDCHVHVCAFTPGHGRMSERMLRSYPFRFLRSRFELEGDDASTERALVCRLAETIEDAEPLDAVVVLAFDSVYDPEGHADWANTHFYVSNDYVAGLSRKYSRMLFGASIHPYRRDAVAELERCIRAGAVLVKWLPIVQGFNPADERCFPFYEALAHYQVPLLSHTGGEQSLPTLDRAMADPALLEPALARGVTVIAAHCGTRSRPGETDFVPRFIRMAQEHENLYGDTSALSLPTRSYAYRKLLKNPTVRAKLIHGSDWPILPVPSPRLVGFRRSWRLLREDNWLRRDILIKQALGFDDGYWRRAGEVLGLATAQVSTMSAAQAEVAAQTAPADDCGPRRDQAPTRVIVPMRGVRGGIPRPVR